MGLPAGTFSSPHAGMLLVTLRGTFVQGTARDAGFPSGNSNMMLRGYVNGEYTPAIDRYTPSVVCSFTYPGGNVVWSLSVQLLAYAVNGSIAAFGFKDIALVGVLFKR